jgi:phosphoribosylformylglycinamidine synthase
MNDFCRNQKIPIVGGNVSFYNEDEVKKTAIKATPMIMIVGLIEGEKNIITLPFKKGGNDIFLIGETQDELGGSEFHSVIHKLEGGIPPKINEEKLRATWDFLFELYSKNLVLANHDVNKGGFVITIAEMCFKNNLGANLDLTNYCDRNLRDDIFLFSESAGRFIIESDSSNHNLILEIANRTSVPIKKIGVLTSKPEIIIKGLKSNEIVLDIEKMKILYDSAIPNLMEI